MAASPMVVTQMSSSIWAVDLSALLAGTVPIMVMATLADRLLMLCRSRKMNVMVILICPEPVTDLDSQAKPILNGSIAQEITVRHRAHRSNIEVDAKTFLGNLPGWICRIKMDACRECIRRYDEFLAFLWR